MSDDLDRKIRDVVAAVAMASPPPPPMPERGAPLLVALVDPPSPARRRLALVVLAAAAAVVVTATSVLVSSSDRDGLTTAGPSGSGIAHQRIAYRQDGSGFDCVDDTEVVTGEFDSLTADVWTSPDGRTHTITEYPDGQILSTIVEDTGIDRGVYTSGADLGRTYRCATADNVTLFAPPTPALRPPSPTAHSSAAVIDDDAVDSTGRPAVLWRERIDGFYGESPLTQISEWYVDPHTGEVLEETWSDSSPRYGTVTWRATLVTDEPMSPPDGLFDKSGHVSLADAEPGSTPPTPDSSSPSCVDSDSGSWTAPIGVTIDGPDGVLQGEEWEITVPRGGTLPLDLTLDLPATEISKLEISIASDGVVTPIRHYPTSFDWTPGRHQLRILWDRRDDAGQFVPAGRYLLRFEVEVECGHDTHGSSWSVGNIYVE